LLPLPTAFFLLLLTLGAALLLLGSALAGPAAATGQDETLTRSGEAARTTASGAAPRITRLQTTTPRVARTQAVTVIGSGFGEARGSSAVTFGGRRATAYIGWSDDRIVCRVPTSATLGKVRVRVLTDLGLSDARRLRIRAARPLGKPMARAPKGTVSSARPLLRWSAARRATSYELRISIDGVAVYSRSRLKRRSWRPPERLPYGATVKWKVRAERAGRVGPWSRSASFEVREPVTVDPNLAWLVGRSYDGGIIAHFYGPGEDPFYVPGQIRGLMVAPDDLGQWPWAPWWAEDQPVATSDWDGASNTAEALSLFGTESCAAALTRACTAGDHHDWYLPAKLELACLVRPVQSAAGLPDDWYWSSSVMMLARSSGCLAIAYAWSDRFECVSYLRRCRVCAVRQFTYPLTVGREYGGGVIGYLLRPGDSGYVAGQAHGLIVATSESAQATTAPWAADATAASTGATATAVGAGPGDTATIVAKLGPPARRQRPYAAYLADSSIEQGFGDWYLPSKDELAMLYSNRAVIDGLADDWYWTSSENDADTAWAQQFPGGEPEPQSKTERNGMLFVRSF